MTYQRFFEGVPMGNRPLMSLGVMMVIVGLQFLVFGLLAEVQARTYYESQNKPIYAVRRVYEGGGKVNNVRPFRQLSVVGASGEAFASGNAVASRETGEQQRGPQKSLRV
jgi:hypothetical protein